MSNSYKLRYKTIKGTLKIHKRLQASCGLNVINLYSYGQQKCRVVVAPHFPTKFDKF